MADTPHIRRLNHTPLRDLLRGRVTGRLDVRGRIERSELPAPVRELIARVVKRTRLWPLERADVADELIAHFRDALDAGHAIEAAIASFGEEKSAARLIRRAKTRNRPLAWHVLRWTTHGIAALIALYVLSGLWLLTKRSDVSVDYVRELNRVTLASAESDRAWPIYREVLERYDVQNDERSKVIWHDDDRYGRDDMRQPGDAGWPEIVAFLRDRAEVLALIRVGAQKPSLGFPIAHYGHCDPLDAAALGMENQQRVDVTRLSAPERLAEGSIISVLLPHLGPIRAMTHLLRADLHLAAEEGDTDRVLANLDAMFGLARHSREHPLLISQLVSVSVVDHALGSIDWLFQYDPALLSDAQLIGLAHTLATLDEEFRPDLGGERLALMDTLQRLYSEDGRITREGLGFTRAIRPGNERQVPIDVAAGLPDLALPLANLAVAPRDEMQRQVDRLFAMLNARAAEPLWVRLQTNSSAEMQVRTWAESSRLAVRYFPLVWLLPAVDASMDRFSQPAARRDALLAVIAIELYRREHGEPPTTWDVLIPRYLPTTPIDHSTGEPLLMKRTAASVVLYGRGVDGDDDGAAVSDDAQKLSPRVPFEGDWVLYPRQ